MTQQQYPHPAPVDELAILVRRLVQSLRKAAPDNDLADQALDYLKRYGFGGTFLRDVPGDVPSGVKPSKASEAAGTSPSANAPENVPALLAALQDAKAAINSMKVEAETAAQGDEQMMQEACEQISNEGLAASLAIDAVLGSSGLHQITEPAHPTACTVEEVQAFEAAAAPAAVAVPDEREAFEKWLGIKPCGAAHDFGWAAWKARAALAAAPAVDGWCVHCGATADTVCKSKCANRVCPAGRTAPAAPENVPALLAGVSAPAVATVERYEIPGGMRAALSDVIAYLRSHSRRDLVRLMQELYDAISPWDCGECSDVPDALMPARPDADYLLSISRNHRWPMLMRAHIKSAARAATQATEAPAADALDDSALLDAMEQMRIAVVPEYEGPWDAEVYNDDGKPKHLGSGSTPREAIRAAIAAQAQEAQR